MEMVELATRIGAPADEVWKFVGDFGNEGLAKGYVDRVEVQGVGLGAIRTYHLAPHLGGGAIGERLIGYSDEKRFIEYEITDVGPLPFMEYSGRISVAPAGPNECCVMVRTQMVPVEVTAEECRALSTKNIGMYFDNLRNAVSEAV